MAASMFGRIFSFGSRLTFISRPRSRSRAESFSNIKCRSMPFRIFLKGKQICEERFPDGFHLQKHLKYSASGCVLATVTRCFATVEAASSNSNQPDNLVPNDPRLRSHECLKNATCLAVDSASAVLSQTVYAIVKIEEQYVELVNVLITLMEYQLQVMDHKKEEQRIADLILETRNEINKVYQRKQDLSLLFASVEKLADASAEVAFAAGAADYASTSAGERLYSAQREVQRVQAKSEEVLRTQQLTEVKVIESLAKREEQDKQRNMSVQKEKRADASSNASADSNDKSEESEMNSECSDNSFQEETNKT